MFIPTATVIMDLLLTREAYYQIFWILPIIIVIAYCAIKISYNFDKHKFDKITLLFFVIILLMAGVNPVSYTHLDVYKRQYQFSKAIHVITFQLKFHQRCQTLNIMKGMNRFRP